jgi:hypothetical protein
MDKLLEGQMPEAVDVSVETSEAVKTADSRTVDAAAQQTREAFERFLAQKDAVKHRPRGSYAA